MKTQILTDDGLIVYDQEIKNFIKNQGIGVTLEEVQKMIDKSDTNTTYTLTKNENNEIVLTGSDGSVMTINDSNTVTSNEIFSDTQPQSQNNGDIWTKFI